MLLYWHRWAVCVKLLSICNDFEETTLLTDAAYQKSCFQMFLKNRESCTVSKMKTRGQMKTQKRNAPSVCQYWRRGRMSGKWHASWVLFLPVAYSFQCVKLCVCEPPNRWDRRCCCFRLPPSYGNLFFPLKKKKTQRIYSNQQKIPECLKISSLMEYLFGKRSGFFKDKIMPPVGKKEF